MVKIKLKDFIAMEVDIDVVDNINESLYIAYCGPMKLTKKGEDEFRDILDLNITICKDIAIVDVANTTNWPWKLKIARKFFHSIAGYCACDDYDRWFEFVD